MEKCSTTYFIYYTEFDLKIIEESISYYDYVESSQVKHQCIVGGSNNLLVPISKVLSSDLQEQWI